MARVYATATIILPDTTVQNNQGRTEVKIQASSGVKHHLYPNINFRIGFNKPPQEWVAYIELCVWKWQTNVNIGSWK